MDGQQIKGYFALVLHSHLPYVLGHGNWPHGTDWLFEAAAETYVPLIEILDELIKEGLSPKITIGITPILAEQLADERFAAGFDNYLDIKLSAAKDNYTEFKRLGEPNLQRVAEYWNQKYTRVKELFVSRCQRSITSVFAELQKQGHIEIITCAATHGYLPLLGYDRCINAQVAQGVKTYQRIFGQKPKGIWLPECAYRPGYLWSPPLKVKGLERTKRQGIEKILAKNDIEYFIIDSHLLTGGEAIGVYLSRFKALKRLWEQAKKGYRPRKEKTELAPYNIYQLASEDDLPPVTVFARDPKTGLQVWSGEWGYPGNGAYLDFHKKHFPGGLRYWRVTGANLDLAQKEQYNPDWIPDTVDEQSRHFVDLICNTIDERATKSDDPPIITAPFDTELFGHWWHEGILWLKQVIKRLSSNPNVHPITCSEYKQKFPPETVITLPEGSWGEGGFHYIWLNEDTLWTWERIYTIERDLLDMLDKCPQHKSHDMVSILKQAARELMLLESSDWQFLISTYSARDYAELRLARHYENCSRMLRMAEKLLDGYALSQQEIEFVETQASIKNIFPDIELDFYKP